MKTSDEDKWVVRKTNNEAEIQNQNAKSDTDKK